MGHFSFCNSCNSFISTSTDGPIVDVIKQDLIKKLVQNQAARWKVEELVPYTYTPYVHIYCQFNTYCHVKWC